MKTIPATADRLLHIAAEQGNLGLIQLLLNNGANIDKFRQDDHKTILHIALEEKNPFLVKFLLDHGADVNKAREFDGKTPLLIAVQSGYLEGIELLLNYSVDINKADNSGATPILTALENGYREVAELLSTALENRDKKVLAPLAEGGSNVGESGPSFHEDDVDKYLKRMALLWHYSADAVKATASLGVLESGDTGMAAPLLENKTNVGESESSFYEAGALHADAELEPDEEAACGVVSEGVAFVAHLAHQERYVHSEPATHTAPPQPSTHQEPTTPTEHLESPRSLQPSTPAPYPESARHPEPAIPTLAGRGL